MSSKTLPPDFTIVVDVDGTLCPLKGEDEEYADLIPDAAIIKQLESYRSAGARIVLYSSRGMRTYKGDLAKIQEHVLPTLATWLKKHHIPFDEVRLGKPWPGPNGFFVDDRAVRPDEFVSQDVNTLLKLTRTSCCTRKIR